MAEQGRVYQLRIDIRKAKPPIWRRVLVRAESTLHELHLVIQAIMAWRGYHLHEFEIDGKRYGQKDPNEPEFDREATIEAVMANRGFDREFAEIVADQYAPPVVHDEMLTHLQDVLKNEGDSLNYLYDFGDDWEHIVKLEKVLPAEAGRTYPVCIKGKHAAPPEDSGGIFGYKNKLRIRDDPSHPDHEWVAPLFPPGFDPEYFDLVEINDRLARLDEYAAREQEPASEVFLPDPMEMTDEDVEQMRASVISMLGDLIGDVQEVLSGYRLSFPSDPVIWMLCANLVVMEYPENSSLAFGLELEANEGPIWLRITGRGAKEFAEELFDL